MAICDAKYRIIYADIGAFGHQSDGGIYDTSNFKKKLESSELNLPESKFLPNTQIQIPCFFVGDGAFPLGPHMMKPFSGKSLTIEKRIYNYRF